MNLRILLVLAALLFLGNIFSQPVINIGGINYWDVNERDLRDHREDSAFCSGKEWGRMALTPDQNPHEITWRIINQNTGQVEYSLGPFGVYWAVDDGYTYHQPVCLEEGCYILEVNDSGGDGFGGSSIFGDYGYEFYYNSGNGEQVITGGDFGAQDVTEFCISSLPCTYEELVTLEISSDFENGPDGWGCIGNNAGDCSYELSTFGLPGNRGRFVLTDDNYTSAITSPTANLSNYEFLYLTIYISEQNIQFGDRVRVSMVCGNSAQLIQEYNLSDLQGTLNNGLLHLISPDEFEFSNCYFWIEFDGRSDSEINVDRVLLTGDRCVRVQTRPADSLPTATEAVDSYASDEVELYPNPAQNVLNVVSSEEFISATISNTAGQTVKFQSLSEGNYSIDTHDLISGVYFVTLKSSQGFITRRFVKR